MPGKITKLQINDLEGDLLFEYECEDNTIAKTLLQALKRPKTSRQPTWISK